MPTDRRIHLGLLAIASGCWTTAAPASLSNRTDPPPEEPAWVMTARGVGPIRATTLTTEAELQRLLPGTKVVTADLGESSGIVFEVFEGSEKLLYIVPDDAEAYVDGEERHYSQTAFAVFAVSPRVRIEGRSWRVGEPFTDDAGIDRCECWGDGEVTACFRKGSHLRAIFEAPCEDAKRDGARAMRGKPIARVMWKRELEAPGLLDD